MARKKEVPFNDNNLAIGYYRFSSSGQDTSVEQQKDEARRYAESHGFVIVREYEDPAKTGTTADRPMFQKMLHEINEIKPAALILWKVDRLSRNSFDVLMAKKTIREAGCKIHYIAEKTPDGSPEDELMERFLENMAAYYSKQLSVNIKRGQKFNYDRGLYLGVKTFGYTTEGEGRHNMNYVMDPDAANVVRRMFRMYLDGHSMAQIADKLNSEGRRTLRGKKFTTNGIRKILKNEAYVGVYKYGDTVIPDGMPVIIDRDTFNKVQEKLGYNKKFGAQNGRGLDEDRKPRFWLTGKLYCGECGESMQGTSGKSHTGTKFYYYSCNDQHKGKRGKGCKKKPVRKEWVEDAVCKALTLYLKDTENLASLAVDIADYYKKEYEDNGYLAGLESELKETEKALGNVIKAVINGASGETINNELNELEERKKGLRDAIDVEKSKQSMIRDQKSIQAYYERFEKSDLSDPEQRELVLDYFVDKIYLYDDKLVLTGTINRDGGRGPDIRVRLEKGQGKKVRLLRPALH